MSAAECSAHDSLKEKGRDFSVDVCAFRFRAYAAVSAGAPYAGITLGSPAQLAINIPPGERPEIPGELNERTVAESCWVDRPTFGAICRRLGNSELAFEFSHAEAERPAGYFGRRARCSLTS